MDRTFLPIPVSPSPSQLSSEDEKRSTASFSDSGKTDQGEQLISNEFMNHEHEYPPLPNQNHRGKRETS